MYIHVNMCIDVDIYVYKHIHIYIYLHGHYVHMFEHVFEKVNIIVCVNMFI